MLDLKELERKFDEILYSFTKKDLENWLKFAEEREARERLEEFIEGCSLENIRIETSQRVFVGSISLKGFPHSDNTSHAIAA